jgi:hypothetical protein
MGVTMKSSVLDHAAVAAGVATLEKRKAQRQKDLNAPVCCFCGEKPVGYFDSDPAAYDEWCGSCTVTPDYQTYLGRKTERLLEKKRRDEAEAKAAGWKASEPAATSFD